ncbi:MAG: DUF167 domain-containing protein [Actinobacteria bacterium]|nr:DUF167 domain-containing protein [Actinomycetota bacterium]MCB9389547.1 DUF167 domain-containing protein [Acidimicrobiia bacterium]
MRFTIRVKPRSKRPFVGGSWGQDTLIVSVAAPAVDGKANAAVVAALSEALNVTLRQVHIVAGHRVRIKLIEVLDPPADLAARISELLVAAR